MKNKGAIELSMTTVVIIVLAMTMLILGLTLVKNIFGGAMDISKMTNEQVKEQIKVMFTEEDEKIVAYLPKDNIAKIKQGELDQVAVGIRNLDSTEKKITSTVTVSDLGNCPQNTNPISWITVGKTASSSIPSGDIYIQRINFQTPRAAPLCSPRFKVTVKEGSATYAELDFDVQILAK